MATKKGPVKSAAKKPAAKKAAPAKPAAKKSAAKKPAAKKSASKGASKGLSQKVQPDAQLAAVVGSNPMPRTEITKKLWDYIKAHGLQDSKNRRMINADDKLKPIFGGKKQVSMFEMTSLVSKHVR